LLGLDATPLGSCKKKGFGFFLLCVANNLTTAYLAIELQGLAFYVFASFVKHFVFGSS